MKLAFEIMTGKNETAKIMTSFPKIRRIVAVTILEDNVHYEVVSLLLI